MIRRTAKRNISITADDLEDRKTTIPRSPTLTPTPALNSIRPTNPFIGLGAPSMFAAEQTSTPAGNNNALIVVALIAAVIGLN